MNYRVYMERAYALAKGAADDGEVPVGAVIVRAGADGYEIIAEAANRTEQGVNSLAHAEILAINAATAKLGQKYLSDCTLFVTMEPCPMCAGAIILSRVGTVVFGCPDSRFGAMGSVFNPAWHKLSPHRPEVVGGIMEEECRAILQDFFRQRR